MLGIDNISLDEAKKIYTDLVIFDIEGYWKNGIPGWVQVEAVRLRAQTGDGYIRSSGWEAVAKTFAKELGITP